MSYFIFNDIKSSDLGVHIQSKNVYSAPKYDIALTSVPGRNGDLISPNGRFANVTLSYTCFVAAGSIAELSERITAVKNWLYKEPGKYHELADSYDSGFKRVAVFNSKLDILDQAKRIGTFTVSFSCKPQRYLVSAQSKTTLISSSTLTNPYPFPSKPYMKIYGSGNGQLVIQNSEGNSIWKFSSIDEYVECDSELMNFYKGTELKNDKVEGSSFPELAPGENGISFSGGITKIEIIPRWWTV